MRGNLVTVRLPDARSAPIRSTSASRQLRWKKSGAKLRITVAKRVGRRGKAASLGGHAIILAGEPAPPPHPKPKWPQ
jgi:hypothetical protein